MSGTVNPPRKYDGTRRQEQARLTRATIVEHATRMFVEDGYAQTTIGAVAESAGVSVETVYKAFGNKSKLVKACFDVAVVGDDEEIPLQQRESITRVREESDPRKKLQLYGEHMRVTQPRISPILLAVRAAANTDPGAAEVWAQLQAERLTGMTAFATNLSQAKALRKGVTLEQARDVLWTYNSVELWDLLVNQRGWGVKRYTEWCAQQLIAALL